MSTIEINQLGEGGTHLDQPQLAELSRRLDGSLLLPGDPGWDSAIQTWNGMVATTPALVIQPRSPGDVSTSVTFAREHGLSISMRGGGHNIAGTSIAPGGVTFNMSLMSSVLVEAEARLVHVDSGCLLGNVDNATQEMGLATVL
ncbi:MAG: FAD-binding oxidoreductase, partial [bacterium]